MPARWDDWLRDDLRDLERRELLRAHRVVERIAPGRLRIDGRDYIDFASNDYLGLACDPRLCEAAKGAIDQYGWGAGAAPLVVGYSPLHSQLEQELATFAKTESVLLFSSGYTANLGVLSAAIGREDIVFSEKRNHASLIDGCRLSNAKLRLYRSDRLEDLERRLGESAQYRRRWIVTDSVFSMDGDCAPLPDLCGIAERFDAAMIVDEAHATGVLGAEGRGLCEEQGVEGRVAIRIGTLSKAFGSVGAFAAATTLWREWLVNHARPHLYSTALPPACSAAALAALKIIRTEPQRRQRVSRTADALRSRLQAMGYDTGKSRTPVVPVIVGEPESALRLADQTRAGGCWTVAIRPPTVAIGTSRVRVSIGAIHGEPEIDQLCQSLRKPSSV